jgi:hypothetical protein
VKSKKITILISTALFAQIHAPISCMIKKFTMPFKISLIMNKKILREYPLNVMDNFIGLEMMLPKIREIKASLCCLKMKQWKNKKMMK